MSRRTSIAAILIVVLAAVGAMVGVVWVVRGSSPPLGPAVFVNGDRSGSATENTAPSPTTSPERSGTAEPSSGPKQSSGSKQSGSPAPLPTASGKGRAEPVKPPPPPRGGGDDDDDGGADDDDDD